MAPAIRVFSATPADLPEVRAMLHEYTAWRGIDLSFQDFTREVANLPGEYAPPTGALLIAWSGADIVGMVAFRRRDAAAPEMKRL